MKTTFLICPVRGIDPKTQQHIVDDLESNGYTVHWPPRDTNQNDGTGLNICLENKTAIINADIIHVLWDGKSQGCLFDLGMAFALNKPISIIEIPMEPVEGKSFHNMIKAW